MTKASDVQVGGDHYKTLPIQPIHYIRENGLGWYEGNIVKYATRHKQKGQIEDIKKVIHYAELILEEYENAAAEERLGSTPDSDEPSDGHEPNGEWRMFPYNVSVGD